MRIVFLSLAILAGLTASAQLINVGSIKKVDLPTGAIESVMSPDGSFAVVNSAGSLQKVDLATGKITVIAENASTGMEISRDGSTLIYEESVFIDRLRYTNLKGVNINSGKETTLINASRNLQGYALSKNSVGAVDNGKFVAKNLNGGATATIVTVASIKSGALCVSVNGVSNNISPQGTTGQSYLWPSVSPDGKKVLYYLCGEGAFVCNLDGSNPVSVGMMRAPKWYNNNIVVGMHDEDNGDYVTGSKLVASSVDGKVKQDLTQVSSMAMYPSVAANGSKMSYVTPSGEVFIMSVK